MATQETSAQRDHITPVDPQSFPSCVGIDLLISDQIGEYNKADLQKIAMDIKAGVPHAEAAFHYVYSRMMGWN